MSLLSYVFWHWRQPAFPAAEYETRQRAFHAALAAAPSAGFRGSFSHALAGAGWANPGGEAYEDWYLVDDSAALDPLNDAAISASRQTPHDAAAAGAAGGTAGLYSLRHGRVADAPPASAQWFGKPAGVSYARLDAELAPLVAAAGASLWTRRMTLGPAPEFCLLAPAPAALPPAYHAQAFALRTVVRPARAPAAARV